MAPTDTGVTSITPPSRRADEMSGPSAGIPSALARLWKKCRASRISFFWVLVRAVYFRLRGKNILCGSGTVIYGLKNIFISDAIEIAIRPIGFANRYDQTFLNVDGTLYFNGRFSVGRGCRFAIGEQAVASFGVGYISANTTFVIMNGITVGDGCAIAWGCQFLDKDFHDLQYPGRTDAGDPRIEIGDHVWIGSNVSVLKGARIPDGCVVASGSVVRSKFHTKNALIAGNPAKVIKENVTWQ